jgi:hypothetical protein
MHPPMCPLPEVVGLRSATAGLASYGTSRSDVCMWLCATSCRTSPTSPLREASAPGLRTMPS